MEYTLRAVSGGLLCTRAEKLSFSRSIGLIKSHQISDSIRDNQTICCASLLSHFGILFGLSQGDIIYLRMSPDRLFVETVLRDESALSAIWSGIIGPAKRPAVLATSGTYWPGLVLVFFFFAACISGWSPYLFQRIHQGPTCEIGRYLWQ